MRKAFATGCNLPYLEGAIPLLRRVEALHPEVERYCIVPPEETSAIRDRLGGLARVMPAPRAIAGIPDRMQVAVAKLFITAIDADVVAWVDCDAVLCRPAPEIWKVEPGTVTAVRDTSYCILNNVPPDLKEAFVRRHPEASGQKGMNAGLFALRPTDWPGLSEWYERELAESDYPRYDRIMDQPLLNALWLGKIRWLPHSFNSHNIYDYAIPSDVRIVHFTGHLKPWALNYPKHEPAYDYWLRYGLGETRGSRLLGSRLRIMARTPRRVLCRALSRWGLRPNRADRHEIRPGQA